MKISIKKPNIAKKRLGKGQEDGLKARKRPNLSVVLLFSCHKEHPNYKNIIRNFLQI